MWVYWLFIDIEKRENSQIQDDIELFIHANTNLQSFKSIKSGEEGIYYHIGIIDYLQPWNFAKKFEKCWKKTIKRNLYLDTSSQNPITYANRFRNELIMKIIKEIRISTSVNIETQKGNT